MRSLVPAALLMLLAGCGEDSPTVAIDNDPGPEDYTDPAALIVAWGAALEAMDLDAYTALLEGEPGGRAEWGFRFYPSSVEDFPWLEGDSWDLAEELSLIGHMFDPEYVSELTGETLDEIIVSVSVVEQHNLGGGEIEVTTHFIATILWAEETGAHADVQLIHVLAPDGDGFLHIREQRGLPALGGAPRSPVPDPGGWGRLKALYH